MKETFSPTVLLFQSQRPSAVVCERGALVGRSPGTGGLWGPVAGGILQGLLVRVHSSRSLTACLFVATSCSVDRSLGTS